MAEDHLPIDAPRGVNLQEFAAMLKMKPPQVEWWDKIDLLPASYPRAHESRFLFHDVVVGACAKALLGVGEDPHRRILKWRPLSRQVREQLLEVKIMLTRVQHPILDLVIYLGFSGEVFITVGDLVGGEDMFSGRFVEVRPKLLWKQALKVSRKRLPRGFAQIFLDTSEVVRKQTVFKPDLHASLV